jgi:hypothetical protein
VIQEEAAVLTVSLRAKVCNGLFVMGIPHKSAMLVDLGIGLHTGFSFRNYGGITGCYCIEPWAKFLTTTPQDSH